jgi:hypothetical protein
MRRFFKENPKCFRNVQIDNIPEEEERTMNAEESIIRHTTLVRKSNFYYRKLCTDTKAHSSKKSMKNSHLDPHLAVFTVVMKLITINRQHSMVKNSCLQTKMLRKGKGNENLQHTIKEKILRTKKIFSFIKVISVIQITFMRRKM